MLNSANVRKKIIQMAYSGQSVHIACAFSLVEIFAVLYRNFSGDGSHIYLSKGHGVMAQYACLNELGKIDQSDIDNYFKNGSRLKGLAEAEIAGVDISSGSLGHGLSVAVGVAFAKKLKKESGTVFCIIGDGEANEGTIWEANMFASHFKLDNLVVIVDNNKYQAMGKTKDVMDMLSFTEKFSSFGFDAVEVNGHDELLLNDQFKKLIDQKNGRPKALVADTVKGKGISFIEDNNIWHYTRLNEEHFNKAMMELSK